MLWTFMAIHPIFINVPIRQWMLLDLWNPSIMLSLNPLPLFPHLSFLWRWHLWYLYILPTYFYQCWHCKWCRSPPIIFWALAFVLFCFFLTLDLEVPPSSAKFFLLRTLLGNFVAAFLLFSNVAYISFVVFLTLACGFFGFSFWWTNRYLNIFTNIRVDWHVSFLSPLLSLTYLYHRSSSLHKLLYIICAQSTFFHFSILINVMAFL